MVKHLDVWHQGSSSRSRRRPLMSILMLGFIAFSTAQAGYLLGLGWREAELQQIKSQNFVSEQPQAINHASYGGGSHIFIKGDGYNENAQSNIPVFYSEDFKFEIVAPPLDEDDAFNSHPVLGQLAYKLPAIDVLFDLPMRFLDQYQTLTFQLFIYTFDENGKSQKLSCQTQGFCQITYRKSYTPVLYRLIPQVVYYNATTVKQFNPFSSATLTVNIASDEKPFINSKISNSLVDYSETVSYDTKIYANNMFNFIYGRVDKLPVRDNHTISLLFENGLAYVDPVQSLQCTFDNSTCYYARSVPVIWNISAESGWTTGGQNLTISGHGFLSDNLDVTIDGVKCIVTYFEEMQFSCYTEPKPAGSRRLLQELDFEWPKDPNTGMYEALETCETEPVFDEPENPWSSEAEAPSGDMAPPEMEFSPPKNVKKTTLEEQGLFVGQHGIRQTSIDYTIGWPTLMSGNWVGTTKLTTDFQFVKFAYGAQILEAWFIPPVTTRYRFYTTCRDSCTVNMGKTANQNTDLMQINRNGQTAWFRDYFMPDSVRGDVKSEWLELEAGQPYYIIARVVHQGTAWISYGVEIEATKKNVTRDVVVDADGNEVADGDPSTDSSLTATTVTEEVVDTDVFVPGHHNTMREVQELTITPYTVFEQTRITVTDLDDGIFVLQFTNPTNLAIVGSGPLTPKATDSEFYYAVKVYYDSIGTGFTVEKVMYDELGEVTTNETLAVTNVYTITLNKLIDFPSSVLSISKLKATSDATVTVELPQNVTQSSPSLNEGKYRIKCVDPDGFISYSKDIDVHTSAEWVQWAINNGCDRFYDKVKVYGLQYQPHNVNGRKYWLRFMGLNVKPGQFEIVNSVDNPLKATFTTESTIIEPFGPNLFYEVVPFEWLRTVEKKPQVMVSVNGEPAVCGSTNCSYTFADPVGEVTSFTYDVSTRKLVLTGTDLPVLEDIDRIEYSGSLCTIDEATMTTTSIECTLDHESTCGNPLPILRTIHGAVPLITDIVPTTIVCTATSVTPNTELSLWGGDNLTISGTYLPYDLELNKVSIKFGDAQGTECKPMVSSTFEMICETQKFDGDASVGQTLSIVITINDQVVSHGLTVQMKSKWRSSYVLTPSTASPVLKTRITITLDDEWPYELDKNDLSCNATNITNPSYVRYLNVISVDNTASPKTFDVMFGGAWTGQYQIHLSHKQYGIMDTRLLILDVKTEVTSYSPMGGSIYGGTLLTIQGTNFGKEPADNPIQISRNGGLYSIDCWIQEISTTQIKCRVDSDINPKNHGDKHELVVFLKVSEEAICTDGTCDYTWTSAVPTVEAAELVFDETDYEWQLKVTASDITGDTTTTELYIADVKQETKSVTSTEVIIKITDVQTYTIEADAKLFFDVGIPKDHSLVQAQFNITPKFVSLSPSSGSAQGTLLTLNVPGIIVGSSTLEIHDDLGNSICESVTVPSFGKIECKTIAQEIAAGTQLTILDGDTTYECVNSDTTQCQYEQLSASTFPLISSVSAADTQTLTIAGSNLQMSGYGVECTIGGILADSVSVTPSQVDATFNFGVPPGDALEVVLTYTKDTFEYYATSTHTTTLAVTASTSALQCSFAGGCLYQVTSPGLSTLLKHQSADNYLTICNQKCIFEEGASDETQAQCRVPQLSTSYSDENFEIGLHTENLNSGVYFGTTDGQYQKAFDGIATNTVNDLLSNCVLGMEFKEGHVAILSQVKFFMPVISNKAVMVDKTKFQGSNDGVTYDDLFIIDENLHEGFNYYYWNDPADQPKYRYYRFLGPSVGGCQINEIILKGIETIDNNDPTYSCDAKLVMGGAATDDTLNSVTFTGSLTAELEAISPRFGTVTGGTVVTFSGQGFATDTSLYKITIDGINCPVSAATSTSVTCTTGDRPGLVETSLEIFIEGQGYVSLKDKVFRYVSVWSDDTTWGGEFAPMEGESVWVPKGLNLYVDIDKSPILNLILVEGSIIFAPDADPNHERFFDANFIFMNGGAMEVGTEEFPYTSKITFTMHGNVKSPYIPIYGNKVIGVRLGTLDMHGPIREPTWTTLDTTLQKGGTQLQLSEAVDWQPGEEIVIASSDAEPTHAEKRTIVSVDSTKKIVTISEPVRHKHFAAIETYGGVDIDMRTEVGLLSRNVKLRGDPETSFGNKYGANIFIHSSGDDSVIGRLSHIELYQVGQAFKVGRYAIHFHMIGSVHKSYIKGVTVHESFNRAFTIHGTNYLRLEKNVAYDVLGHTVFVEDAAEHGNYIYRNLIVNTRASFSLLNTDTTPACFWMTHPDNIFVENHAAGCENYGYWYDLQSFAMGPSATQGVCPVNHRVGEHRDNHVHSVGKYGLRLFHAMNPRKYSCLPISATNPTIPAELYRLTAWQCGNNGVMATGIGDVRFNDFMLADNHRSGIEVETLFTGGAWVSGGTFVGQSQGNGAGILDTRGIIGPQTDHWLVKGAKFYNYDGGENAALSSCSHCGHPATRDAGARIYYYENLFFDDSVTRRINYGFPDKGMFYDRDGTLTGLGAGSWATPHRNYHDVPGCSYSQLHGGTICEPHKQLRKIQFYNYLPQGDMRGEHIEFKIEDEGLIETSEWGGTDYTLLRRPSDCWVFPIVAGHKYHLRWAGGSWEFKAMSVSLWDFREDDLPIFFNYTYTIQAAMFQFTPYENNSIPASQDDWISGQNLVNLETKEMNFVVNGKRGNGHVLAIQHYQCWPVNSCNAPPPPPPEEPEDTYRYWSDPSNWPDNKVPGFNDTADIMPGWEMILDVEETEVLYRVNVYGKLYFSDEHDVHLRANTIFVRTGELHIGSAQEPYQHNAKITFFSNLTNEDTVDDVLIYDQNLEGGYKLLANVNKVFMYGKGRDGGYMTRLAKEAQGGDTSIFVELGLDIRANDTLALAATSYGPEGEQVEVLDYNATTGEVKLKDSTKYYHYGAEESTASKYDGLDIRGEVLILTRNIQINSNFSENSTQECSVANADTIELSATFELVYRKAQMVMDHVELANCLTTRFENTISHPQVITNSVFRNGTGYGFRIARAKNIKFQNNIVFEYVEIGLLVTESMDVDISGNFIGNIAGPEGGVPQGGFAVCSIPGGEIECTGIDVYNNIAAGVAYAGFVVPGHECGDYSTKTFKDNVAHSVYRTAIGAGVFPGTAAVGVLLYGDGCFEGSNFMAYKCEDQGAFSYRAASEVRFSSMVMVDNAGGFGAMLGGGSGIYFKDIKIHGESEALDCPENGGFCYKYGKVGFMYSGITDAAKDLHVKVGKPAPIQKCISGGVYGGIQLAQNVHFTGFDRETRYGQDQRIIINNPTQPDYLQMQVFEGTVFTDIETGAMARLSEPAAGWANLDDCGDFPCTAPLNQLIVFKDSQWVGRKPIWAVKDFQIIANNPGAADYFDDCKFYKPNNGYICKSDHMGILLFQSDDPDNMDRAMQPIYVEREGTGMSNKLNAFMDHVWDGIYSSQKRLQRFPAIVQGGDDRYGAPKTYVLNFTGSPAKKMTFVLRTPNEKTGFIVKIFYPSAQSRQIFADGEYVEYTQWDKALNNYGNVTGKFCGENRYLGVVNIFEFYINGECSLQIRPRNAIQTMVRMEFTMEEFYAPDIGGGPTRFVDRLCGTLGIHASQVKIVSVYEGSVIINYDIIVDDDDTEKLQELKEAQAYAYDNNLFDFGANILGWSAAVSYAGSEETVTDSTYNPINIISPELQDQYMNNPNYFNPELNIVPEVETVYVNQTRQIELEPEVVVTTKTVEVEAEAPDTIVRVEEETSPKSIIVPIAFSVLACGAIAVLVRYCVVKKRVEEIEVQCQIQRVHAQGDTDPREHTVQKMMQSATEQHEYEAQYDPNNDFAIFGVGDLRQGGLQTMQEKMNLADAKSQGDDSSDEDPRHMAATAKRETPQSDSSNSGAGTTTTQEKLPEDKEIHSDHGEEE